MKQLWFQFQWHMIFGIIVNTILLKWKMEKMGKKFAEKFRDDQDAFFASYAKAHKKLSELGSKFEPVEGIIL